MVSFATTHTSQLKFVGRFVIEAVYAVPATGIERAPEALADAPAIT